MVTKKEDKKEEKAADKKKPVAKKVAKKTVKAAESKKANLKKADQKKVASKKEEAVVKPSEKKGEYFYAVGRRKRAIATVRLYPKGKGVVTVNDRTLAEYLPVDILQEAVVAPMKTVGMDDADVTVKTYGGGMHGQAGAIQLGIARALLKVNEDFRTSLKPLGVLTRDSREKERKKYGLKKARRAPQWAKR